MTKIGKNRRGANRNMGRRSAMKLNSLIHIPVSNSWKSLNCCIKVEGTVMSLQPLVPQLLSLVHKAVGKWKIRLIVGNEGDFNLN